MFDAALKQTVGILKSRVDDFSSSMSNWWERLDKVQSKVNGLYKMDFHKTERPKVDILDDKISDEQTNLWNYLDGLRKRIEKLENKI